jgi:hypothetical protein
MSPSDTVSCREMWPWLYEILEANIDVLSDADNGTPGVSLISKIEQNNTIETGHTLATRPGGEDARRDQVPRELDGRFDLRPPLPSPPATDDEIRDSIHRAQRSPEDAECVAEPSRRNILLGRHELAAQVPLGPPPQGQTGRQHVPRRPVSAAEVSTICLKVNQFKVYSQYPGPNTTRPLDDIGRSSHRPREKVGPANQSW